MIGNFVATATTVFATSQVELVF